MTYDDYIATQEDIMTAFFNRELTEVQLHIEMEQLQEEWDEFGEEC